MTLFFEPKKKASNWKERKKKVSKHYVSNQYRVFLTYQCAETTQLLVTSSSLSQHEKKHFYLRTKILIINCTKHKMNVYYIFIMLLGKREKKTRNPFSRKKMKNLYSSPDLVSEDIVAP